jgi:hypothetical protein
MYAKKEKYFFFFFSSKVFKTSKASQVDPFKLSGPRKKNSAIENLIRNERTARVYDGIGDGSYD